MVREALFDVVGERVKDKAILDLFAGSGAVGLEALSRGASFVLFVDNSRAAKKIIEENIRLLGFEETAEVFYANVFKLPRPRITHSEGWLPGNPGYLLGRAGCGNAARPDL